LSEFVTDGDSKLGLLARQAEQRSDLSAHLRNHLPPELGGGFVHCNVRADDTLVVTAASPEWAARLRFETPRLLQLAGDFGSQAHRVKVKVAG